MDSTAHPTTPDRAEPGTRQIPDTQHPTLPLPLPVDASDTVGRRGGSSRRRRWRPGLRSRVVGWYALLLGSALVAVVALAFETTALSQRRDTEEQLRREITALDTALRAGLAAGRTPEEATTDLLTTRPTGDRQGLAVRFGTQPPITAPDLNGETAVTDLLDDGTPRLADVNTGRGPARVLVTPIRAGGEQIGTAAAVRLVGEDRRALLTVLWTLIGTMLLALVVASALSWSALGRLLRPVTEMARTAREISEEDLGRRIRPPTGGDEIALLGVTFNRMLDRLQAAFERERRFLDEASHELRTPITICRGHLDVLGPDPTSEEVRETVGIVTGELDRMGRIVEDLTTLARAEQPGFVRARPVEVAPFLADLAGRAAPLLSGRLSVVPPDGGTVHTDPQRLTQALLNLLRNTAVHTPPGTPVELRAQLVGRPGTGAGDPGTAGADSPGMVARPTGDMSSLATTGIRGGSARSPLGDGQRTSDNAESPLGDGRSEVARWRFEVADDGPGLEPGTEEAVFRAFERAGARAPGSGLGLAIVRAVAEAHGGRAGVEHRSGAQHGQGPGATGIPTDSAGRAGRGAVFWMELPA